MEEDFNLYKDQPLDSLLIRPNADKKREKAESVRYYFASVTGVDRAFGQILETLKSRVWIRILLSQLAGGWGSASAERPLQGE